MQIKRIFDLLEHFKEKCPNKPNLFGGKENNQWVAYSTSDVIEKVNHVSYGLMHLGVKKDDKIASITFNRPEWNFLDHGIQQIGAIHIPIYPTISDTDYLYILKHAEVKYIFVAGEEMYQRILKLKPEIPSLITIYTFRNLHGKEHLGEVIELGKQNPQPEKLQQIKNIITEDDIATIIYTSGTTGHPKGVILKHSNLISNFIAVSSIPTFKEGDIVMSFLPICHVYERMMNYMYQYCCVSVYYVENLGLIAESLKEIQPVMITTVPRLLEKVYDKFLSSGRKLKGIKKMLFFWAVALGLRYEIDAEKNILYKIQLKIARKLIFSKWKEALGGKLDMIVSGGAALQPRLCRIYWAAGFRVIEGYGLTETSPVIAVNTFDPNGMKFGTVGPVLPNTQVKIAPDGEILTKGPGLMSGYYKEPEMTKAVIDNEGWFHTGDVGRLDNDNFLKITGRKKEIFKTSFGKYIAPMIIEDKFKESPFIDNLIVLGENQKFAAALIAPDFPYLKTWCEYKGIPYTTNEEMLQLPRIRKRFAKEVNKYNEFFGETEQIKKFELLPNEWNIENGELTATLKLRRTFIANKYQSQIKKLFSIDNEPL